MLPLQYFNECIENGSIVSYIYLLILMSLLHYFFYKRYIKNIFDLYFFPAIANIFSFTLVVFMYLMDDISKNYFASFILTQLAIYIGFFLSANKFRDNHNENLFYSCNYRIKSLFYLSSSIYLLSTMAIYGLTGIPLFKISRLGAFEGSGGLGIIERLSSVTLVILLLCFSITLVGSYLTKGKFINILRGLPSFEIIVMIFVFTTLLLSGSKATFYLVFVVIYLVKIVYFRKYLNVKIIKLRYYLLLFITFILSSLFVIYIQTNNLAVSSDDSLLLDLFSSLLFRFFSFGDIYIYSYFDDNIKYLIGDNPIVSLFGGALSTLRLFPASGLYEGYGLQLSKMLSPTIDVIVGPNPRHNVIGLYLFGPYLSLLYSFSLGIFIGIIRNIIYKPRMLSNNVDLQIITIGVLIGLVNLDADFSFFLSNAIGFTIIGPVIFILNRLIHIRYR